MVVLEKFSVLNILYIALLFVHLGEEIGANKNDPSPSELPIVRAIRQISFPGSGGGNRPFSGGGRRPFNNGGNRPFNNRPSNSGGNQGVSFNPRPTNPFVIGNGGSRPAAQNAQCDNCVPLVACTSALEQNLPTCSLPDANLGVCCTPKVQQRPGQSDNRLFPEPHRNVQMGEISSQQVNAACEKGVGFLNQVNQMENRLMRSNQVVQKETPEHGHLRFFKVTRTARDVHRGAVEINQASRAMMNDLRLSPEQSAHGLRRFSVRNSILADNCPRIPNCNPNAKYRTIDGTCNNLANPLYGKSETAFQRILPPLYDDGVSSPRTRSADGIELPSERIVASTVLVDRSDEDQFFTTSVMQWAQFIDHDLTHAPFASLRNNEGIECCPGGRVATGSNRHPDCWPIEIPRDDPFYAPRGRFCMNFVRSMLGLTQDCTFGYAEQMNQITHWLDGSNIYGSNAEEANRLRQRQGGLLRVSQGNLLPIDQESGGDCEARQRGGLCYHAGDSRVNEQPGLTAIHTLWHREHNRVARILQQLNPQWSDEAVYQEARRIVIAEMQHIVFNEWLPIIVGTNFMESFGISPLFQGYSFDYNSALNPNMNNEFATGAFRFGHSLVQGQIRLFSADGRESTIRLRDHFNSPHIFQQQPGVIDMFARSFTKQAIQKFDTFVTDDLSNHLFQTPRQNFGMDLMSLNLHRGRDHGIATYNLLREACGLAKGRNFADINDQIPADILPRLQRLYGSVDDIDFFVGGMAEKPVRPGLLGWTFLCVVGDQFARIKKGDRFFYDIGGQPGSFNPVQLQEIRKTSWARILCDNSDNLGAIQPLAFRLANNHLNRVQSCNSGAIPRVNIAAWQGEIPQA